MPVRKRGQTWYIDIQHKGKRHRFPTRAATREEAEREHDEFKAGLWGQSRPAGKTLTDAAAAWLTLQERSKNDRYALRQLLASLGAHTPLTDLTSDAAAQALGGTTPGTHNRYRNLLLAVLNVAVARGWLAAAPDIPARQVRKPRVRFLTAEEWSRLRDALPPHLRDMATFALATGLRRANVTHLEWSQVDERRRIAWIHPDQAKAGEAIAVPLSDDAVAVLRRRREIQAAEATRKRNPRPVPPWVFTFRGKPQVQISTGWKEALGRAGIESTFRWHDLRHTWASWHVMAGTPLEVLQKLGGWHSFSMVLRYAHLAPGHLAQFANNARPYRAQDDERLAG